MGYRARPAIRPKANYGGLEVSEAKRLRALEDENGRPEQLLADVMATRSKPRATPSTPACPHPSTIWGNDMTTDRPILVTGATGAQGGAVIDALLQQHRRVRALCRPTSNTVPLAERGVEIAIGDLDDQVSLNRAAEGASAVFSVQLPPAPGDDAGEERAGQKLVEAAKSAGVDTFVHTSVARAGDEENFAGWQDGRWWKEYWTNKTAVNELVKSAGFKHWVIFKPAYMMENFIPPKVSFMFPALANGVIETAITADTRLDLIAADDIGRFAAAAFIDPARFNGQVIDLAGDSLTMDEVASVIGDVAGKPITTRFLSYDNAVASGIYPGTAENHVWLSVEGYKVDPGKAAGHGIALESFAHWVKRKKSLFVLDV